MSTYRMSKEMLAAIVLQNNIVYKKYKIKNEEIIPNETIFNIDSWNNAINKMNEDGWKRWLYHYKFSPENIMNYITKTHGLLNPVTHLIVE